MRIKSRFLIVFLVVFAGFASVSGFSGYLFFKLKQLKEAETLCHQAIHAHEAFRRLTSQLLYTDTLDHSFVQWKDHYKLLEHRLDQLDLSISLENLLATKARQATMETMMVFWNATRERLDRVERQISDLFMMENPSRDGLVYQYFDLENRGILTVKNNVKDASLYLGSEFEASLLTLVSMVNREIERQTHVAINRIVQVTLAITVSVILILAFFLSNLNFHLKNWLHSMNIIGKGEFPEKIPVTGKNELSQISTAINLTATNLQEIYRELEKRIEELHAAKENAELADKAKSQFLAHMSHELKTPLNAIIGFSQILLKSDSLDPDQKVQLSGINRNGMHLLGLITDVLTMAKIEAGRETINEKSIELYRLMREMDEMFSQKVRAKGILFSFSVAPQVPACIQADETRLRQVMINILQNALKYTDAGKISIFVSIEVLADLPGGKRPAICFVVKDTGCGIEKDQNTLIFDSFVQAGGARVNQQQGTGLGLAICKKTIAMMGGSIGVESVPGTGSMFWFKIPLAGMTSLSCPPQASAIGISANPHYSVTDNGEDCAIYEEPHVLTDEASLRFCSGAGVTILDRLSRVPADILERMEQAALRAEIDQLKELIDVVREYDHRLAMLFSSLADDFAYDKLIDLLHQNGR